MTTSHPYDPSCPHCVPALLNPETGEVCPKDHPAMIAIMKVWNSAPFKQRQAYIAITVHNSRDPNDLSLFQPLVERIQAAVKSIEN